VPQGKGLFLAWFLAFFGNCAPIHFNGRSDVRNVFDSCVKSWQYFRTHGISLNSVSNWFSYDTVRFKIEVVYTNVTVIIRKTAIAEAQSINRL